MSAERAKARVRPRRDKKGNIERPLRYDGALVVNGRVIVHTAPQGYNKRHRAREALLDAISGKFADAELDDPGVDALER